MIERLQKILSHYGIASRREAERLILDGQVCLNGLVVIELGTKADPDRDRIEVNGKVITAEPAPQHTYLLLHKPVGVVCTRHDPQGRRTILDLLPDQYQHLYPVGRLDYNSSGALLLTNDGELTNRLTHPRHHVPKTYEVWIEGQPSKSVLQQWRQGVEIDGKLTLPADVEIITTKPQQTLLQIVLREGRNRQIRRVAEQLGYPVISLHRGAIASITLENLKSSAYRALTKAEVQQLQSQ